MRRLALLLLASVALLAAGAAVAATPAVSANGNYALAVHRDGRVFAWGWDDRGQLGRGRTLFRATPQAVSGLPPVAHADAGTIHAAAADTSGNVWTWGQDTSGQLGPRTHADWSRPARVIGVSGVQRVVASMFFTAALRNDGTVLGWGSAIPGLTRTPAAIPGFSSITQIRGGFGHLVALKSDGTVWTVGNNDAGQLGNGTSGSAQATAQQVPGLANIVKISAGHCSSVALRGDGAVFAWGQAACGYPSAPRHSPEPVSGLSNVVEISAGFHYTHAVRSDGSVVRWENTYAPAVRAELTGVAQLVADSVLDTVALKQNGTVAVYGGNSYGEHGQGNTDTIAVTSVVPGLASIVLVTSAISGNGGSTHYALAGNGTLYAWGANFESQLGVGESLLATIPVQVQGLPAIAKVVAGDQAAYALDTTGRVWAWGDNGSGVLGDGTITPRSTPVQVAGITDVVDVAAGRRFVLFLKSDGTVWGIGVPGALVSIALPPAQVTGLANITALAARYANAFAIRGDGKAFAWGANYFGQVGDGTTTYRADPVMLSAFDAPVTAIAAGHFHTLARTSDGGAWSWGDDLYGQLGNGAGGSQLSPVRIPGLAGVSRVAAAYSQSLALLADGSVRSWGSAALGDAAVEARQVPGPVQRIVGIAQLAAANYASYALAADGVVYAWGGGVERTTQDSVFGAPTGDGTIAYRRLPVPVLRENALGNLDEANWFLDLDGTVANTLPASLVPRIVPVATATVTKDKVSLGAGINFRAADNGKHVGTYIFGQVPVAFLNAVKLAPAMAKVRIDDLAKADGLVFVQLTPDGWTTAGNQLVSFASGVIAGNGGAQSILNGVPIDSMSGARFCIGYGESADAMLSAATMRDVLNLGGATSSVEGLPCVAPGVYMSGPPGSNQGTAPTFTATVAGIAPTGTVQFRADGAPVATPQALSSTSPATATAALAIAGLAPGLRSIGGHYSGDALNAAAHVATPVQHVVAEAPANATSTVLTGPATSGLGESVAFTATVIGNNLGGSVQFTNNGAALGAPVALLGGTATLRIATLPVGASSLVAAYTGSVPAASSASAPLAHVVFPVATTTLQVTSSTNPSPVGSAVTLTATVGGNAPTGNVTFASRGQVLATATLSGGAANATLTELAPGVHEIHVAYPGDGANPGASTVFFQQVDVPATRAASTTVLTSSANPAALGQTVNFTATVGGASGTATGSVQFRAGGAAIPGCAARPLAAGSATCSSNALANGTHSLTAAYSGNDGYLPSTSAALSQAVLSGTPLLTAAPTSLAFGGQSMRTTSPSQAFTLTNASTGTVNVAALFAPASFAVAHTCGTLAPGASCTATVSFTPTDEGEAAGLVSVTYPGGGPTVVEVSGTGERSLVTHYYRSILNRAPDEAGKSFWSGEFARLGTLGANPNESWFLMANYFFNSAEYQSLGKSDTQFLADLYTTFFNRAPDGGGMGFWQGQIDAGLSREGVTFWFMFSNEFRAFTEAIFGNTPARPEIDMVMDLFRGLLNRFPETAALNAFVGTLRQAQCASPSQRAGAVYKAVNDISYFFIFEGSEYANRNRTNRQYVSDMYNAFLRRGGTADELAGWITKLGNGTLDRHGMRATFIATPEFGARVNAVIAAGCLP